MGDNRTDSRAVARWLRTLLLVWASFLAAVHVYWLAGGPPG